MPADGVWTAPFSRDIVLVVRGPMRIEIEDSRVLRVLEAAAVELSGPEIGTVRPPESAREGLPIVRLGRRDPYVDE